MPNSINQTSAASLQAYVRDYSQRIRRKLYFGFPTAGIVGTEMGVKGERVLPQIVIGALSRRYRSSFNPRIDAIEHTQRVLKTHLIDVDLEVNPTEYQGSYLGHWLKTGQDPKDWPFEAQIIDGVLDRILNEMEIAIWQGQQVGSEADAPMIDVFDGIHKIIEDEVLASNLSPLVTGAITNTNAVAALRNLYKSLAPQYQLGDMDAFINPGDAILYLENYQNDFGTTAQAFQNGNTFHLDIGQINVHRCPGIKPGAIIMTPKENIVYGLDGTDDHQMMRFKDQIKSIEMSLQFRIGVQLGIISDELVAVNDQH